MEYSTLYRGNILLSMKILKDNHCPNCGVYLAKVRGGIAGTPCGMFHQHPGVAQLVISVVNGENDNFRTTLNEGQVITETIGDETYESVSDAVIAILDTMHDVQFPSEG